MRVNADLALRGARVLLVPYLKRHVAQYHQWMQDPHILHMTASEPLSEEEEYAMQASWRDDDDKCTFIIVSTDALDAAGRMTCASEAEHLVGDVNMYLHARDESGSCEIEVMVGAAQHRRRGLAKEALQLMMRFGVEQLRITRFYAKINKSNEPSLGLFRGLGFSECNYVEAFEEFELELVVSAASVLATAPHMRTEVYSDLLVQSS